MCLTLFILASCQFYYSLYKNSNKEENEISKIYDVKFLRTI